MAEILPLTPPSPASSLAANPLQAVSDEALVIQRRDVLDEVQKPRLSTVENVGANLGGFLAAFGLTVGLKSWNENLRESGSGNAFLKGLTSLPGRMAAVVVVGGGALLGISGYLLRRKAEANLPKLDAVNVEIAARTGRTPEQIGQSPITAADLTRMKEAHQAGRDAKSQVEKLETAPEAASAAAGR